MAAGAGGAALRLARHVARVGRAVDAAPNMVARCQGAPRAAGLPLEALVMDGNQLQFASATSMPASPYSVSFYFLMQAGLRN